MKNYGLIPGRKQSDWLAGSIPHEVRNPSGVWQPVRGERQRFRDVETMSCVSQAANTMSEIQILHQTGGEVNFSDRFLAKVSGTTTQGNRVSTVLDALRKYGAVFEDEWPVPPEPMTWAEYYSQIVQFIIDRARHQFPYDLQYEYVPDITKASILHHLKHAPLMVTVPGHEMVGLALDGDRVICQDSYPGAGDFIKKIPLSRITDIYKAVLTVKNNMSQIKSQAKGMSRRIVLEASSWEEWVALCKVYGKDPDAVDESVN